MDSKNGDSRLTQVKTDFLEVSGINGDISLEESHIKTFDFHTINGDMVYRGPVGDLTSDVITGDIYITKTDQQGSNLNVKTVSGDVKIAIPKSLNIEMKYDSSFGEIKSRMVGVTQMNDQRLERHLNETSAFAKIDVKTNAGDIYLKDQGE